MCSAGMSYLAATASIRSAQRAGLEFGIFVEQRRNEDRPQHHADQHEQADHARPPQPAAWRAANDSVDRGYDERARASAPWRGRSPVPPPRRRNPDRANRSVSRMSGVDRPWQRHRGRWRHTGVVIMVTIRTLATRSANPRIAHAVKRNVVDEDANQRAPEQQPVPSLEIRIRLGAQGLGVPSR